MAQYGTIITNIGLAQIANAQITQTKVGLEYIALGDGNGAHYVPKQNQTALVHEVWRGSIAELSIDPTNNNRIIIDAVIPVTAGGFTIREIGIFDDKNNLIAVGQYPEKYKPQLSEGVSEETLIHFVIETINADVVKLTIDPTVIIASRNYVDGKVAQVQTALTEHSAESVASEDGVHDIRYFNNELAIKDDQEQWNVVEVGGSGDIYQENIIRNEKSNAIGFGTFADSTLAVSQIGGKNDTGKFFVALNPTGFAIGDNVKLKYRKSDELLDAKITNIGDAGGDMKTFYLETTAPLNNELQLVVKLGGNTAYQTATGKFTFSSGDSSFAMGEASIAIGTMSIAEGFQTIATGAYAHSKGLGSLASGTASVAQGSSTVASGHYSFAGGQSSKAEGDLSVAIGQAAEAKGRNGISLGNGTKATGDNSFAANANAEAIGTHSAALGMYTTANDFASVAIGRQNKAMTGSPTSWSTSNTAFLIGNGQGTLSNAFRVMFNGNTYGWGAWNSTGADYAEFFEWSDANLNDEDRVGFVVTLEGDKIRKATNEDTYILGIISATPSVIGDSHQDDWQNKYVTDEWGRIQHHWVDVDYHEVITINTENGLSDETVTKTRQEYVPIINPNWNNDEEYIPREDRKEWDAVGLMGKLLVRDDGTCKVNNYAKIGDVEGILTASNERTDMRVIERISPNIVRVFIK